MKQHLLPNQGFQQQLPINSVPCQQDLAELMVAQEPYAHYTWAQYHSPKVLPCYIQPGPLSAPPTGTPALPSDLPRMANKLFRYPHLHPIQPEAIHTVHSGEDTYLVAPPLAGKSLGYMIPTLVQRGFTIVLSARPDASMARHLAIINKVQIPCAFGPASQTVPALKQILETKRCNLKFLFMCPPWLEGRTEELLGLLGECLANGLVQRIVILEANLASNLSKAETIEFPRMLKSFRAALSTAQIVALTTDPSRLIREDLKILLHIPQWRLIQGNFNKPNLRLIVVEKKTADFEQICTLLNDSYKGLSGVILCPGIKSLENLARYLSTRIPNPETIHSLPLDPHTQLPPAGPYLFLGVSNPLSLLALPPGVGHIQFTIMLAVPVSLQHYLNTLHSITTVPTVSPDVPRVDNAPPGPPPLPPLVDCIWMYREKDSEDQCASPEELVSIRMYVDEARECRRVGLLSTVGQSIRREDCFGLCDTCQAGYAYKHWDAIDPVRKILAFYVQLDSVPNPPEFTGNQLIDVLRDTATSAVSKIRLAAPARGLLSDQGKKEVTMLVHTLLRSRLLKMRGVVTQYNTYQVLSIDLGLFHVLKDLLYDVKTQFILKIPGKRKNNDGIEDYLVACKNYEFAVKNGKYYSPRSEAVWFELSEPCRTLQKFFQNIGDIRQILSNIAQQQAAPQALPAVSDPQAYERMNPTPLFPMPPQHAPGKAPSSSTSTQGQRIGSQPTLTTLFSSMQPAPVVSSNQTAPSPYGACPSFGLFKEIESRLHLVFSQLAPGVQVEPTTLDRLVRELPCTRIDSLAASHGDRVENAIRKEIAHFRDLYSIGNPPIPATSGPQSRITHPQQIGQPIKPDLSTALGKRDPKSQLSRPNDPSFGPNKSVSNPINLTNNVKPAQGPSNQNWPIQSAKPLADKDTGLVIQPEFPQVSKDDLDTQLADIMGLLEGDSTNKPGQIEKTVETPSTPISAPKLQPKKPFLASILAQPLQNTVVAAPTPQTSAAVQKIQEATFSSSKEAQHSGQYQESGNQNQMSPSSSSNQSKQAPIPEPTATQPSVKPVEIGQSGSISFFKKGPSPQKEGGPKIVELHKDERQLQQTAVEPEKHTLSKIESDIVNKVLEVINKPLEAEFFKQKPSSVPVSNADTKDTPSKEMSPVSTWKTQEPGATVKSSVVKPVEGLKIHTEVVNLEESVSPQPLRKKLDDLLMKHHSSSGDQSRISAIIDELSESASKTTTATQATKITASGTESVAKAPGSALIASKAAKKPSVTSQSSTTVVSGAVTKSFQSPLLVQSSANPLIMAKTGSADPRLSGSGKQTSGSSSAHPKGDTQPSTATGSTSAPKLIAKSAPKAH